MVLTRKKLFESIKAKLEGLQGSIGNGTALNHNDLAVHAENFFRDLLNRIYGWKLENTNFDKQNTKDIDLADRGAKLAIQVTARNDQPKIKKTLDSFYSDDKNAGYRLKFMFISREAVKYEPFKGHETRFKIAEDIIDIKKLLKKINDLSTPDLESIAKFLEKEIDADSGKDNAAGSTVSNETHIEGFGNLNLQGLTGSTVNINLGQKGSDSQIEDQNSKIKNQKFLPTPFIPDLKYFVGRDDLLANLRSTLDAHHKASIHDISGLGKTFACYKFADENKERYSKIFFVNAAKEAMMESLARLGQMLHPGIEEAPQEQQALAFKNWLETNDGWLVIYDNVDEPASLKPFVPNNTNGNCLFTSNDPKIRNLGTEVPIDTLEKENAARLLFRRSKANIQAEISFTGESEEKSFWRIVDDLDGLPVALNTTGAFIEEQGISYTEYLENLEASPDLYLEHDDEFDNYGKTILKAFALALDTNTTANRFIGEAVDELYRAASLIAPDDIPEEFLRNFLETNNKEFAESKEKNILWQRVRKQLQGFDLFKYDPPARSFSTHRLIQKCIQSRLRDTKILYCEKLFDLLIDFFPVYNYNNKTECERYYHHIFTALTNASKAGVEAKTGAGLYFRIGEYQRLLANYREAEEFHTKGFGIAKKLFGDSDNNTAIAASCLAMVYESQGRFLESEEKQKEAVEIGQRSDSRNTSDQAARLNNLASVYKAQGRYPEALLLFKRAIGIAERTIGKENPDYASALNNLAGVYNDLGKYGESIKLFEKAAKITEKTLSKEHPSYAACLTNLAGVYGRQSRHSKALELNKEATEITRKTLGIDHPDYAACLNNLAFTYLKTGKYAEALPRFEDALRILQAKLSPQHQHIVVIKKSIQDCKKKIMGVIR